jgi:hypothetical protein
MSVSAATGVVRIARFQADGLAAFDATPAGLLHALTPWFAFALVAFLYQMMAGAPVHALSDLLASVVALLAPPVLSHALARLWHREARWLRYAVALAWCQWVMPAALLLALVCSFLMMMAGLPETVAERVAMFATLAYALALNVFLARRGLDLSLWRAVGTVVAVNLGTAAAVVLPVLILTR